MGSGSRGLGGKSCRTPSPGTQINGTLTLFTKYKRNTERGAKFIVIKQWEATFSWPLAWKPHKLERGWLAHVHTHTHTQLWACTSTHTERLSQPKGYIWGTPQPQPANDKCFCLTLARISTNVLKRFWRVDLVGRRCQEPPRGGFKSASPLWCGN